MKMKKIINNWLDGIKTFNKQYDKMLKFNKNQRAILGAITALIGLFVAITTAELAGILILILGLFLMI